MSEAAIEANRRNGRKSHGPNTKRDSMSPQPNTKHGIFAKIPVIRGFESQEEWDEFLLNMIDDFKPNGYLETNLVEEIASLMWRKRRAIYTESLTFEGIAKVKSKEVAERYKTNSEMLYNFEPEVRYDETKHDIQQSDLSFYKSSIGLFENFENIRKKETVNSVVASFILKCILEAVYTMKKVTDKKNLPENPFTICNMKFVLLNLALVETIPTAQLIEHIESLSIESGYAFDQLMLFGRIYAKNESERITKLFSWIQKENNVEIGTAITNNPNTEKQMRYEASLDRMLAGKIQLLFDIQDKRLREARENEVFEIPSVEA